MSLKILLLQARQPGDPICDEERSSFVEKSRLGPDQLHTVNLPERVPSLEEVRSYDALMIGGAGEYCISLENMPNQERYLDLLREVVEVAHPTFAACFGYQSLVHALGGELIYDPGNIEVGTFELELTQQGEEDSILGLLPRRFSAQMGRKDRAVRLPPGVPNLASSELCPMQALRLPEKPIWATQFHPELDGQSNRARYLRYLDHYAKTMPAKERETVLSKFQPSPETGALLAGFVQFLQGESPASSSGLER